MAKRNTAIVVVVALVVVLGGAGVALAATKKRRTLDATLGAVPGAAPGETIDPTVESLQVLGEATAAAGGKVISYIGGEAAAVAKPVRDFMNTTAGKHLVRDLATGGLYTPVKTGVYVVKKTEAGIKKASAKAKAAVKKLKFW